MLWGNLSVDWSPEHVSGIRTQQQVPVYRCVPGAQIRVPWTHTCTCVGTRTCTASCTCTRTDTIVGLYLRRGGNPPKEIPIRCFHQNSLHFDKLYPSVQHDVVGRCWANILYYCRGIYCCRAENRVAQTTPLQMGVAPLHLVGDHPHLYIEPWEGSKGSAEHCRCVCFLYVAALCVFVF